MGGNSFEHLFTANSYNLNSDIRLRVSDTKSRLRTSKDGHFRLPEVQGKKITTSNRNYLLCSEKQDILVRVYFFSTVRELPCSSNLLSNCYQPEQLKTSHKCEISHYILRPVIIHSHGNIIRTS